MQWVSTGEKTNHSYVCALGQTALVYPCSFKGSVTCLQSAGKRTSWRPSACWCWWPQPPSQGIPAERDFVPSVITQPACLAIPPCPFRLVISALCPVYYGALCCVCLMIYCFICSYYLPEELVSSRFIANAPNHLGRHLQDGKEPD